uniref:J domain-containing protein n=1 Tax=viral metagenome TaxID=1070528 RepID=A0A6C0B7R3_9ZZZZ
MVNHYEALGLSKDANATDIKKAYRKLSLQYHPDRNSSEEAIVKMHAINSAYEILSDNDKRRQYNMELEGGMPFQHMNSMDEFSDINQLFSMMFGGMQPGMPGPPFGGGVHTFHSAGPGIRVFQSHGGPGNFRAEFSHNFQQAPPPPIEKTVELTLEQCYRGCSIPIDIERWSIINGQKVNEVENVTITFPQGIDESDALLMKGHGHLINEQIKGDVHVSIKIINRTPFKRQGLDLILRKNIPLKDALCGFTFDINHVNGKTFTLNNATNPSVIYPGFKKVINELGMKKDNITGNLIIELDIDFPDKLTEEQINSIKNIL